MGHVEGEWKFSRVAMSGIHHRHNLMVAARLQRPSIFNKDIWVRNQFSGSSFGDCRKIRNEDRRPIDFLKNCLEYGRVARNAFRVFV